MNDGRKARAGRIIALVMLVAVTLMSLPGCVNLSKVSVGEMSIKSITPKGLRNISGTVSVKVDNGTTEFTLTDISGTVFYDGTPIFDFSVDPVTVAAKTADTYDVRGSVSLDNGITLLSLVPMLKSFDANKCTADVKFRLKPKGVSAKIMTFKGIRLGRFIDGKSVKKKVENLV